MYLIGKLFKSERADHIDVEIDEQDKFVKITVESKTVEIPNEDWPTVVDVVRSLLVDFEIRESNRDQSN